MKTLIMRPILLILLTSSLRFAFSDYVYMEVFSDSSCETQPFAISAHYPTGCSADDDMSFAQSVSVSCIDSANGILNQYQSPNCTGTSESNPFYEGYFMPNCTLLEYNYDNIPVYTKRTCNTGNYVTTPVPAPYAQLTKYNPTTIDCDPSDSPVAITTFPIVNTCLVNGESSKMFSCSTDVNVMTITMWEGTTCTGSIISWDSTPPVMNSCYHGVQGVCQLEPNDVSHSPTPTGSNTASITATLSIGASSSSTAVSTPTSSPTAQNTDTNNQEALTSVIIAGFGAGGCVAILVTGVVLYYRRPPSYQTV